MTAPRPTPAPRVAGLTGYVAPSPAPGPVPVDLRLDGTERTALPPAVVLAAAEPAWLHRYPDAKPLEATLAARLGIAPDRVAVTAGADEALDRLCRAVAAPGRTVVCTTPTFEMIPRYARLAGADVVEVPWIRGPFPLDAVRAACRPDTALVFGVSPNNPTGAPIPAAAFAALAAAAPQALVVADLAYVEFADADPTAELLRLPNAVAIRTLSKAWGCAGLRVGYAAGPADAIGWLRAAGGPYAVSRPSLALAAARLAGDDADVRAYIRQIREERGRLAALLANLGAEPLPSQANFVLARFRDAADVRTGLAARGIAVRAFPGRPELDGWLRIACPADPTAFTRLEAALIAVLPASPVPRPPSPVGKEPLP